MAQDNSGRAGRYVSQLTGYRAFIPAPLPPEPPLALGSVELGLLSAADHALGRLDGVAHILPNPSLFVAMYVRREAVLSSQIEGTQSTLDDVLAYELEGESGELPADVHEVVNYVRAMYSGLSRLSELPVSLRLIREIHAELLASGRGAERRPGEFRTSQNWIGPEGGTLATARFVPPPPHEMTQALDNLEKYLHAPSPWPNLVDLAMVHAQFETIHPFLDGNGRVGRLLVAFMLVEREVLGQPLLYLSYYLRLHRTEYYDRLTAIREQGDWEGWIRFFLDGVRVTASEATQTAVKIDRLAGAPSTSGGRPRRECTQAAGPPVPTAAREHQRRTNAARRYISNRGETGVVVRGAGTPRGDDGLQAQPRLQVHRVPGLVLGDRYYR